MPLIILIPLLVLLGFLLLRWAFNPAAVRRRKLARQARADYRDARGTAHLRLLRTARTRVSRKAEQCVREQAVLREQIAALDRECQDQLMATLEHHIAYSYLDEVEGIGPALKQRILATVFRRHLTDLYAAGQVRGVGSIRYMSIRRWVLSYLPRLPQLLEADFPGKAAVLDKYAQQRRVREAMLRSLETQAAELDGQLARLRAEIDRLDKVKPQHFVQAMTGQGPVAVDLNGYLQGSFAEWEPIPDWFREAVGEVKDA